LSGRDEVTVQPILKWVVKAVNYPQYAQVAVDVACLILDIYAADMVESPRIWRQLGLLHENVIKNVELAQEAIKMQGMMDLIMTG
jgi:U3 small nucleolar RNA-associated protein 15